MGAAPVVSADFWRALGWWCDSRFGHGWDSERGQEDHGQGWQSRSQCCAGWTAENLASLAFAQRWAGAPRETNHVQLRPRIFGGRSELLGMAASA